MTGDHWVAVVGIAAGVVGTLAGLVFAFFSARADRTQVRVLARSGRLHAQRLDVYAELSAYLERERLYIERTEPKATIGGGQDPPDPLDEEDWLKMIGRVAIAGSDEVETAIKNAQQGASKFAGALGVHLAMARQGGTPIQQSEARQQMDDARDRAVAVIEEAQRVMRDELANL
jgi:hypothetical protein